MNKRGKGFFSVLGEIFSPLIPAFLASGMCAGFASILSGVSGNSAVHVTVLVLRLVSLSFTAYLSAWIGIMAAKRFGATMILGGLLGMASMLSSIEDIANAVGLEQILHQGSGGAIAVVGGVWLLSRIEGFLRKRTPAWFNQVFSPFVALVLCLVPYVFIVMPLIGFITEALSRFLMFISMNERVWVRIVSGFICASLFLPAQMLGLQPVFQSLYILQIESTGVISIAPILAMAGAAQVGVAISVLLKSRAVCNHRLSGICAGGILPGVLGIGNALLSGMSVPYPRALLATCLGAGVGGSFMAIMRVSATGLGSSGILAIPLMTAGAGNPAQNMFRYTTGLAISLLVGFLFAMVIVQKNNIKEKRDD